MGGTTGRKRMLTLAETPLPYGAGSIPVRRRIMLYWALVFLVVALVAGALGFGGVASASAGIAQVLFFIFLVLFAASLIMGFVRRR